VIKKYLISLLLATPFCLFSRDALSTLDRRHAVRQARLPILLRLQPHFQKLAGLGLDFNRQLLQTLLNIILSQQTTPAKY